MAKLPMNYDTYIFDLYGTLVDIRTDESDSTVWERLALFFGYYGADYTGPELKTAYEILVGKKEAEMVSAMLPETAASTDSADSEIEVAGDRQMKSYNYEASPEIELTGVFLDLYRSKGVEADQMLAVHTGQFLRVLSTKRLRLYPGTLEMLRALRDAGKQIYLLSNAQRIFTEYEMKSLKLWDSFDDIFISSDYGVKKPDRRFFEKLLAVHPVDKERTLFVGNDSRTDIGGARNVGLHTFYVKSAISPKGDSGEAADYNAGAFDAWEK